ncbi:lipopolysaccharide biosynthesis protein [Methylobacterium oryzihabitans]|uniref:Polysaccharide biosynthesis protein n=1 Tax=Methylobacterium oryzihabitans TaxID=2499852 RepID=A0A3S2V6Z7_9HYPH|nr:oligosaccharide flippase family protein [Methylobacterium oryzihabitans]RVU15947.1 hypothetical protein EOE48_17940 [Methylobacterium oryzihabitans]
MADPAALDLPRSAALRGLRRRPGLGWLGHPSAYAVGVCVVSLLSMATTLVVPHLLDPAAFGAFALLGTVLQYAARADLGLSQLADRDLASRPDAPAGRGDELLRASWALGLIALAVLVPAAMAAAWASGRFAPLDAALAVAGGVLGMVAHAPTMLYRAAAQHWEFTTLALLQQAGLTAPRLAGLVLGGVTGCFAALVLWSGGLALLFGRPRHALMPRPRALAAMVRAGLPLFVFNALWLVYMTANRWVSAALSNPEQLGLFAFGANLAMVGLALVGAIAQVRYPRLLAALARAPRHGPGSPLATIEREAARTGLVLAAIAVAAVFLAGPAIRWIFPAYAGATGATVGLALSCVPLGVVAWIVPMAMVLTDDPLAEAARVLGPSLAILVGAIALADAGAGITGQGFACAGAGLVLLARLAAMLRRAGILSRRGARRLVALQAGLLAGLALAAALWLPGSPAFPAHDQTRVQP